MAGAFVMMVVPFVGAEVASTSAVVSASVQELMNGSPSSVNSDRKQFEGDSSTLPLDAAAALTSTDLSGILVSVGQAFGRFADPNRLDEPNPQELAIEVACYSNTASVAYLVNGAATESRTVLFRDEGLGSEIDFRSDGTREVESRIFVNGAVVLWSTRPGQGPSALDSEVRFVIEGQGQDESLFETGLTFAVDESNRLTPLATGPMRFDVVTLEELGALGAEAETIRILESISATGQVIVVVIPPQEHVYSYLVTADEEFLLTARLEARVRNAPDGSGVAAVLGRPFRNLASFVALGLPGVNGEALERSINQAALNRDPKTASGNSIRPSTSRALCGALGMEVLLACTAFGLLARRSG